jgi:hypothetical protein
MLNSGSRTCSLPQRGQREGVFSLLLSRNPNPQELHSGWRMMSRFFPFELLRICSRSSRMDFTGAPTRRARLSTVMGPLRRISATDWRLVGDIRVSYYRVFVEASSERSGKRHGQCSFRASTTRVFDCLDVTPAISSRMEVIDSIRIICR